MSDIDVRMFPNILHMQPAKRHLYRGQWLTVAELAELTGIPRPTITARLLKGRAIDQTYRCARVPKKYLFRGALVTVREAAIMAGIHKSTANKRVCGDRILEKHEIEPALQILEDYGDRVRIITYRGKSNSLVGWERETGINRHTLASRLNAGWTIAEALTRPVDHRLASRTTLRNRRIISLVAQSFREQRNHILIHRIVSAFRATTGGYIPTFTPSQRTGGGRHARDLQSKTEKFT